MKKVFQIVLTALIFMSMTSCSMFLEPQQAESSLVLNKVYQLTKKDVLSNDEYSGALYRASENLASFLGMPSSDDNTDHSQEVKLVEWKVDTDQLGENYTGYLITYSVMLNEKQYYTLVSLLEWDDASSFEITHIATEKTITAINHYIE